MKKILIALALVTLAISPTFAGKVWNFTSAADTIGWEPSWNNGNVGGTIAISWSATGGRGDSGCMIVTITKGTTGTYQVNLDLNGPPCVAGYDTTYSVWLKANSTIQPPWYWIQAYAFTAGWGWTSAGANGAATWTQYVNSGFGAGPTPRIGLQLPIDDSVAVGNSFIWVIDSVKLGADAIPIELVDFDAKVTKK